MPMEVRQVGGRLAGMLAASKECDASSGASIASASMTRRQRALPRGVVGAVVQRFMILTHSRSTRFPGSSDSHCTRTPPSPLEQDPCQLVWQVNKIVD